MHASTRAAGAALLLLAACGGTDRPADEAASAPGADTSLTVAEAPSAALDTAQAVAARGDTAAAAAVVQQPGAPQQPGGGQPPFTPPARQAPANPITADEVQRYGLTMDRIRQLVQAGQNLAELHQRRPEMRDSMAVVAPDPNAILERLTNVAPAREAVSRAGLSPRDYTLATMALMQAAMVSEMRRQGAETPPIPVNEANVRLVRDNWEEIQRLTRAAAPQP